MAAELAASGAVDAGEEEEVESVADEAAGWFVDFWQPAMATAKQKAKTLAQERRRFMNYLRVGWAVSLFDVTILRSKTKSILGSLLWGLRSPMRVWIF